jgi:hypothetical protein
MRNRPSSEQPHSSCSVAAHQHRRADQHPNSCLYNRWSQKAKRLIPFQYRQIRQDCRCRWEAHGKLAPAIAWASRLDLAMAH